MNLDELNGFFGALIAGPDDVLPSEYLPEIWGDAMVNEDKFRAQAVLQDFFTPRNMSLECCLPDSAVGQCVHAATARR
jgi:yecA family protein